MRHLAVDSSRCLYIDDGKGKHLYGRQGSSSDQTVPIRSFFTHHQPHISFLTLELHVFSRFSQNVFMHQNLPLLIGQLSSRQIVN